MASLGRLLLTRTWTAASAKRDPTCFVKCTASLHCIYLISRGIMVDLVRMTSLMRARRQQRMWLRGTFTCWLDEFVLLDLVWLGMMVPNFLIIQLLVLLPILVHQLLLYRCLGRIHLLHTHLLISLRRSISSMNARWSVVVWGVLLIGNIVVLCGQTLPLGSLWCRYLLYLGLLFNNNVVLSKIASIIFLVTSNYVLQISVRVWHSVLKEGWIVALGALFVFYRSAILRGRYHGELLRILLDDVSLRATHIIQLGAISDQFMVFRNVWLTCLRWRRIGVANCCVSRKDLVRLQLLKPCFSTVLQASFSWHSVFQCLLVSSLRWVNFRTGSSMDSCPWCRPIVWILKVYYPAVRACIVFWLWLFSISWRMLLLLRGVTTITLHHVIALSLLIELVVVLYCYRGARWLLS